MRKRLLRAFWIGNALTLMLVLVFVSVMVVSDIQSDLGSLKAILNTASSWTLEATSNLQELADQIAASTDNLRVTFLMPSGIILADSEKEEQDGQALLSQPAVKAALKNTVGEDITFFENPLAPSLNAAILLNGRLLLHLRSTIREIRFVITVYLPLLALMVLGMVAVSRWLVDPVTRQMIRQLEEVRDLLEGSLKLEDIDTGAYTPELRPILTNITYLIARLRQDLKEVSKTRDMQRDFVDNSSHELKSPLTSITGFAEMLAEEPDMPLDERREYLGYILTECQRMAGIINDILLLERQGRQAEDNLAPISLYTIAEQVAQSLAPQAARKEIEITVTGDLVLPADEKDMWELLRNLMGNAVRYGREGGYVKVDLAEGQLSVADNGIGIEKQHEARLFEKFYRVDDARHRQDGGTGLGLAIVAAITNRYGASIHVDSQPGVGSVFTVTFARKM